jgi:hypothetical protein
MRRAKQVSSRESGHVCYPVIGATRARLSCISRKGFNTEFTEGTEDTKRDKKIQEHLKLFTGIVASMACHAKAIGLG